LFVAEGARVALLDRDGVAVAAAADSLNAFSAEVDVTNEVAVKGAVEGAALALGGLDGLVNCAGIAIAESLSETSLSRWMKILDVNLTGPMLVARAALPYLEANASATIVNVASGIALRPFPRQGAYAASKAGLLAWTKVIAQELGPKIRVNAICPGSTDTPLMRANMPTDLDKAAFAGQYVLKRQGEAHEQAHAILFLTGPESTFITGVSLAVDGGRTFH